MKASKSHVWKQLRCFGFMIMKKLALGKEEHRIQEEAWHLVECFDSMKGSSLDPSLLLGHAVADVICTVVFEGCFSVEDENFHRLLGSIDYIAAFGNSFQHFLYEFIPWVMDCVPGPKEKTFCGTERVRSFIQQEIRSHEEIGRTDEPENFIDFYLAQMAKTKEDPRSTYNGDNLVQSIFDLFLAGIETETTSLHWAMLYMVA
ncbi:hypothetical protein Y1Q_0002203 [Alligator mississippiensis]|uniref:Uncharacterized protein n=1 Tax=Alligator mississippiensis TaxID=8496 RepID=A0A151PDK5_ALLMI|nr:hypothetical protein Y1Q_0002203 [Alligator mississippiensis]